MLDYIPDQSAATNAAVAGDVDVALEIDPELRGQIEGTNAFTIESGLTTDKGTLAFNNQRAPLNDQRVREALRLAIDHKALIETLGSARSSTAPSPRSIPATKTCRAASRTTPTAPVSCSPRPGPRTSPSR